VTRKINYFQKSKLANPFKGSNNYNIKFRKLTIEHLDDNNVYYRYN